jgi:hypothetical protein
MNELNNPLHIRALPLTTLILPTSYLTVKKSSRTSSKKHINIAKEIAISIRSICRFSIKLSKKQ